MQGQVSASLDNTSEVNWKKKTAASTFNLYKALDAFTMVMNILGKTFYVHVSHFQICLWRFASFALLFYKLALFTLARGGPNKANGCQLHYTWYTNCRLSSQIKKTNNHRRCHQSCMFHVQGQFINTMLKLFILVPFQFSDQVLHIKEKVNEK